MWRVQALRSITVVVTVLVSTVLALSATTADAVEAIGGIARSRPVGHQTNQAFPPVWTPSGLADQWVYSLAVDPHLGTRVYAGTNTGLYRSTDGGLTWQPLWTRPPSERGLGVLSVVVDPTNPSILWAGSLLGFYKSTDAGVTFTLMTDGLYPGQDVRYHGTTVTFVPGDPQTIYIGMFVSDNYPSLFKTTNGGATWTPLDNGPPPGTWTYVIAVDPTNTSTVYAGMDGAGVYKTTNGGASWTQRNPSVRDPYPPVRGLVIDQNTASTLYVGIGLTYDGGVYKSTDGAATWAKTLATDPVPGAVFGMTSLILRPGTQHEFYGGYAVPRSATPGDRGGRGVLTFQDGGPSRSQFGTGLDMENVQSLAIIPGNPQVLLAGTSDHGLFRIELPPVGGGTFEASSLSPAPNASDISTSPTLRATFTAPVVAGSMTEATFLLTRQGDTTRLAASVVGNPTFMTLTPVDRLAPGTTYVATVKGGPSGVRAEDGRTLPSDVTWTFTTAPLRPVPLEGKVQQLGAVGSYDPTDARAPAGVYSIEFRLKNVSPQLYIDLAARITELTNGNILINRVSGSPPSVGAIVNPASIILGSDQALNPGETFTLNLVVGLQTRAPFRIAFTGTGIPADSLPGGESRRSTAASSDVFAIEGAFSPESAPQPTPEPTATLRPTPGPSQPAGCAPRPKIEVRTAAAGPGQIEATITTEATAASPDNALQSIQVTSLANAQVQVVGGPALRAREPYTVPGSSREVKLLVSREQPGPMTAHLQIADRCGTHTTFVGAGAGVR